MAFEAKYNGVCDACDERIVPGQLIRRSEDYGDFIHDDCDAVARPDPTTLRSNEVVCTECWLVKPCGCEVT